MDENILSNLLYTIYTAGYSHGVNEGAFPDHGTYAAFKRLISGQSPLENGTSYNIKHNVENLYDLIKSSNIKV